MRAKPEVESEIKHIIDEEVNIVHEGDKVIHTIVSNCHHYTHFFASE